MVDETERLRQLAAYGVLDTPPEDALDELVALASSICGTPIALVSLVDGSRQWFKAKVGLDANETPRDIAFCAHVVAAEGDEVFVVEDARKDARFSSNPFVTGDPNVVFYAGAPLVGGGGAKLGTLCVIDRTPRTLTAEQTRALRTLSRVVVEHLELRRAVAEKLTAESQLRRIFDLSLDLLGWASPRGYFVRVNPAFERTLGWTAAELYAEPIDGFVHPDDVAATRRTRASLTDGATASRFEQRFRHKDGTYRWLSWNVVHAEGVNYFVARDVTAEQLGLAARTAAQEASDAARAEAERAKRAMDAFLAMVSHELRTPLNAMLGWTRLLRGGSVPEEKREKALETIERNASIQAKLIEDLLDVSRIVSGNLRLEVEPVELVHVIEAALDDVRPTADEKGVTLSSALDSDVSYVMGDAARLQQIVWNLLANAVKFTSSGDRVELGLTQTDAYVAFTVTDTGKGMDPAFVPHVFDRFRQAEDSETRAHGGLGLGLAIVKTLVELHGGTVAAASDGPGKGARFEVRLPVPPRRAPLDSAKELPFDASPSLEGVRVLVVDDDEDARELLSVILERCGAVVTLAGSVAEAIVAFAKERPDVVVSDVGMPGEDGHALVRQLRALPAERGGTVPAVALTGYARAEDRMLAAQAGFDTHVPKPVQAMELVAVVARLARRGL